MENVNKEKITSYFMCEEVNIYLWKALIKRK